MLGRFMSPFFKNSLFESPLSRALPVFQGLLKKDIIEQKFIQEHILNYFLKKHMENPAEALFYVYGCYCVGSLFVSVGVSTLTGAVHGLLVTAPASDTQQSAATMHYSIADRLEAAGIFIVRRTVRCMSGAVGGAYQGVHDSFGLITAPWARLFQPLLGSDIKKQTLEDASTQTPYALSSLDSFSEITDSEITEDTEIKIFSPIDLSPSVSTLGQWSPASTPNQAKETVETELKSKSENHMYDVLAQHYESFGDIAHK